MSNLKPEVTAPQERPVEFAWANTREVSAQVINVAQAALGVPLANGEPEFITLIVGRAEVPAALGPAQQAAALGQTSDPLVLPAEILGRFFVTRKRAEEILNVLALTLQQFDAALAAVGDEAAR